jgi:flavin reductase (DIM6/NTAB) family NADH-FMN oxidoreductase RutF
MFESLSRQQFRRYFQPSRIVMAVLKDQERRSINLITLCFHMYCSYKPPMMAFSIFHAAHSFSLVLDAAECVLSIPGERLANTAMYCGLETGRQVDKFAECGLSTTPSKRIEVPGIQEAIANVELRLVQKVRTGDHVTVIGEVVNFSVDKEKNERCLISVGPRQAGYELLARSGIHRIAVVDDADFNS